MARFAGSRTGADFQPIQLSSGGSGGNYGAAASAVDLGDSFSAMREKAPRYDLLSGEAMNNRAEEEIAAMNAAASVMGTGMAAYGNASSAALQARGQIEAAEKAAEAQKQSSMFGAVGGIIGTGLKLLTGGLA
jgi:hypothetical protein